MANQEQATGQVQETQQAQGTDQAQADPNQATQQGFQEQIQKAIAESIAPLKSEIAGLNRKNAELEKAKRDAEISKLPEKEQWQTKLKELEQKELDIAKKEKAIERSNIVKTMASKYKLTDKLAERLIGETEAEIEADARYLSDFVAQEVQTKSTATVNEKLSGKPPVGGSSKPISQIQALEKTMIEAHNNGDLETANRIYFQLQELKKD